MDVINDKIVNVPISDDDIIKNVISLPRTKETNGFVNLKMKRRLQYKHYYKMETVRPEMVYKALLFLKENNPFYRDIKIIPYEDFLADMESDDKDDPQKSTDQMESSEDEDDKLIDESESNFNNVTCLSPEDLTTSVIVNTSKTTKKKSSI